MVYKPKKLIMSIFTLGLTAATLTTSTYAWFSKNTETWVDDFNMTIENTESLLISVDGKIFKSSLDETDIKKAISAKLLGKSTVDLTDDEVNAYQNIELSTVSTSDLSNFVTIDSKKYSNGYYTPVKVTADESLGYVTSYISFDLYFRKESTQGISNSAEKYDLMFVDDTYAETNEVKSTSFTADTETIKLNNALTALENGNVIKYGPNEDDEHKNITVNPADAIRVGVYGSYNNTSYIYEPNLGLGSYAYKSHEGYNDKYDPNCSAMLTYFNNIYKYDLAPLEDEIKTYDLSDKALDTFIVTTNSDGEMIYQDVCLTVYIWLDGYDADYIPGIDVSSIKTYLSFYVKEHVDETTEESNTNEETNDTKNEVEGGV